MSEKIIVAYCTQPGINTSTLLALNNISVVTTNVGVNKNNKYIKT